jgi:hypothetical protein
MAEPLDERTLREGVAILAALEKAKLTASIWQVTPFVDGREPEAATYRVRLGTISSREGTMQGTAAQLVDMLSWRVR